MRNNDDLALTLPRALVEQLAYAWVHLSHATAASAAENAKLQQHIAGLLEENSALRALVSEDTRNVVFPASAVDYDAGSTHTVRVTHDGGDAS